MFINSPLWKDNDNHNVFSYISSSHLILFLNFLCPCFYSDILPEVLYLPLCNLTSLHLLPPTPNCPLSLAQTFLCAHPRCALRPSHPALSALSLCVSVTSSRCVSKSCRRLFYALLQSALWISGIKCCFLLKKLLLNFCWTLCVRQQNDPDGRPAAAPVKHVSNTL